MFESKVQGSEDSAITSGRTDSNCYYRCFMKGLLWLLVLLAATVTVRDSDSNHMQEMILSIPLRHIGGSIKRGASM